MHEPNKHAILSLIQLLIPIDEGCVCVWGINQRLNNCYKDKNNLSIYIYKSITYFIWLYLTIWM